MNVIFAIDRAAHWLQYQTNRNRNSAKSALRRTEWIAHLMDTAPQHGPKTIRLGIVIRKTPGVTRWASWCWTAVAVLPGAGPADWRELRREGDVVEYHVATVPLELWRGDTEAYLHNLTTREPSIYVVMRRTSDAARPLAVLLATAAPYEGQDYQDSGDELVERVPMPEGLAAVVADFVRDHHEQDDFVKRRRDRHRVDGKVDGKGDARIRQAADVYRAPLPARERMQ